ncbi:MAG TPA: SDR family oxidoreductase [Pyrinomonadaceae bacterium]|nr:SDR family oxidoreductase [Pyrinomonadaceae bacterium]
MSLPYSQDGLRGRVAVVAGATRGAGRGIAMALGEAGATVICTGRSSTQRNLKSDYAGRPETIEETAELVTKLGGRGIAIPTDHLVADEVQALADRLQNEFGKIDILVNDIWGAEILKGGPPEWDTPVWKLDLAKGLRILRLAIDTHIITSKYLLPLLIEPPRHAHPAREAPGRDARATAGLLVEVTDGTTQYNATHYRISVYYDLAKVAVNRLAFSQGHELAPYGATAVAITPGWMRSEMMLENFGVSESNWREALDPARAEKGLPVAPPDFAFSETPRYVGRAIASLALDPERARWNQQSLTSGQLARVYGFTDLDGTQPDVWGKMEERESHPQITQIRRLES